MICIKEGWDAQLIAEMKQHYPDTNGVLWHNDGTTKDKLNTLCILGHTYYKRFNYIYSPEYASLWSDNEFMEVSQKLNKVTYFEEVLFEHRHHAWGKAEKDSLYDRNDKYYTRDKEVYERRKARGFDLLTVDTHSDAN